MKKFPMKASHKYGIFCIIFKSDDKPASSGSSQSGKQGLGIFFIVL